MLKFIIRRVLTMVDTRGIEVENFAEASAMLRKLEDEPVPDGMAVAKIHSTIEFIGESKVATCLKGDFHEVER